MFYSGKSPPCKIDPRRSITTCVSCGKKDRHSLCRLCRKEKEQMDAEKLAAENEFYCTVRPTKPINVKPEGVHKDPEPFTCTPELRL